MACTVYSVPALQSTASRAHCQQRHSSSTAGIARRAAWLTVYSIQPDMDREQTQTAAARLCAQKTAGLTWEA